MSTEENKANCSHIVDRQTGLLTDSQNIILKVKKIDGLIILH
jgi:hypothetical protein